MAQTVELPVSWSMFLILLYLHRGAGGGLRCRLFSSTLFIHIVWKGSRMLKLEDSSQMKSAHDQTRVTIAVSSSKRQPINSRHWMKNIRVQPATKKNTNDVIFHTCLKSANVRTFGHVPMSCGFDRYISTP